MKLGDALHSVYTADPVQQHMKTRLPEWKQFVKDFAKKVKARQDKSPRAQKRPGNAPGVEEYEYAEDDVGDSAGDDGKGDGAYEQGQNTSPATQTRNVDFADFRTPPPPRPPPPNVSLAVLGAHKLLLLVQLLLPLLLPPPCSGRGNLPGVLRFLGGMLWWYCYQVNSYV